MARRMVAMDSASSCGPHPNDHPPPPTAQDPNPSVVILSPLESSRRVGNAMCFSFFYRFDRADSIGLKYLESKIAGSTVVLAKPAHCTDPKAITFTPVSNVCALAQSGASKRLVTCSASTPLATEARPHAAFLCSSSPIKIIALLASFLRCTFIVTTISNDNRHTTRL